MGNLVTYKLLDRKTDENSFFLNQDGSKDEDRKLDFTNSYGILNPFWVVDKETGKRVYYQYIEGVDFYDPQEQKKQGIIANMQNSNVFFNKGADIIIDDQLMAPLVKWMDLHPINSESIYHDPARHDSKFYRVDHTKIIKKELDEATIEDEALLIFGGLRKDKEKMRSVALLFEDTKSLPGDDEIYLGLREIAKKHPKKFIDSIANKENEVLSQVLKAQTGPYGIIGKDAKGYFYEDDKTAIFLTSTKQKTVAEAELVSYLISAEGDLHYRQLLVKIQKKEIDLQSPSGSIEEE